MARKKIDPLKGLSRSLEAENAVVERRFNDAERFTSGGSRPGPRKEKRTVRDTFSFPRADHELIGVLQRRCYAEGFAASKSELVRAGLQALEAMTPSAFAARIAAVEKLKPGPSRRSDK